MTIKDLSDLLGIPQSRLKKLCLEILNCIPADLSGDDEARIRSAIATTTQTIAAATDATSEMIKVSSENLTESQAKVADILGESIIKRLVAEYLKALSDEYKVQKFQIDSLQFEIEQRFYSQLSSYQESSQNESIQRVKRNSNYFSLEGLKSLPHNDNSDDLLSEIASFMEVFNEH